jgi:hypothetical protein
MRLAATLLLAALTARAADALYFYLAEGEARCFIEEVPPETLIVGNYKNPDFVPFGSTGFTGSVSGGGGSGGGGCITTTPRRA